MIAPVVLAYLPRGGRLVAQPPKRKRKDYIGAAHDPAWEISQLAWAAAEAELACAHAKEALDIAKLSVWKNRQRLIDNAPAVDSTRYIQERVDDIDSI